MTTDVQVLFVERSDVAEFIDLRADLILSLEPEDQFVLMGHVVLSTALATVASAARRARGSIDIRDWARGEGGER